MRTAYLFDVDGTLTPSRCGMNGEFRIWFCEFMSNNDVFLVTGSDYGKTVEQLGTVITENVKRVYGCSGNDVWQHGRNTYSSEWKLPDLARTFLISCEYESPFEIRTGNHIEERPGTINFSIVGRNCTLDERKLYIEHDVNNRERESIAHQINSEFPNITATVGGETGIDIAPRGANKSQILRDFKKDDTIHFYGDAMFEGGNDLPLAYALKDFQLGFSHQVDGWQHTWEKLREYTTNGS